MSWDAIGVMRACLGDGLTDKFEHKAEVTPTPDGANTDFFCGHTRVIDGTFSVVTNGEDMSTAEWTLNAATGVVTITGAPTETVLCSYYWQWFQDAELEAFLNDASSVLGYTGFADTALPVGLRSATMDYAMALAFTRKASESADSLQAGAPDGYSIDTGKSSPQWLKLAWDATQRAQMKLKWFVESPLAGGRPSMAITTFNLPVYTPRIR